MNEEYKSVQIMVMFMYRTDIDKITNDTVTKIKSDKSNSVINKFTSEFIDNIHETTSASRWVFELYCVFKVKMSSDILLKLLSIIPTRSRHDFDTTVDYINRNANLVEVNLEVLKYILQKRSIFFPSSINEINLFDKLSVTLIIDNGFYKIYKNLVETEKVKVCFEHLICACGATTKSDELVEFIIDKGKLIPTHECFDVLLKYPNLELYDKDLLTHGDSTYTSEIIDILINSGLQITLDDVKFMASNKIEVFNFDFEIDEELVDICIENKFKPKYLSKYNFTQKTIQNIFLKYNKVFQIKDLIGSRKVNYDTTCLKNACSIRNNSSVIRFLLKKGVVPDLECLKTVVSVNNNNSISYILNGILDNSELIQKLKK